MRILDDFLSNEDFYKLRDKVFSPDFPWFFQEGKSELYDGFRYGHSVWMPLNALVTPLSFDLYNLIAPIINKLDAKAITRIKLNSDIITEVAHASKYHVDNDWCNDKYAWTGIYYLNTNNGYTEFEFGGKVGSVENRLLLFRADQNHRGVGQTDTTRRVVLNINMMLSDGNPFT